MNNKELYITLGALKALLETGNEEKAVELINNTMALIEGKKVLTEEDN